MSETLVDVWSAASRGELAYRVLLLGRTQAEKAKNGKQSESEAYQIVWLRVRLFSILAFSG